MLQLALALNATADSRAWSVRLIAGRLAPRFVKEYPAAASLQQLSWESLAPGDLVVRLADPSMQHLYIRAAQ